MVSLALGMKNSYQTSIESPVDGDIESLKLRLDGYQAHYLKAGSGQPAVVMVHGGASDCGDWLNTIAALSDSYSVYAPDLVGYGMSESYKDGYCLSDFVEFTLGFTEALGLDSHVLVGHSLGGRICLEMALRHPDKVHKLVLVDTVGFGKLSFLGRMLGAAAWGVRKVLGRPQPYPDFLRDQEEDGDWLCLDELPGLRVPTLIVWNRFDPYYPVTGAMQAAKLIPEARLAVLPGYGHAPHVKKQNTFNRLLQSFLDHH